MCPFALFECPFSRLGHRRVHLAQSLRVLLDEKGSQQTITYLEGMHRAGSSPCTPLFWRRLYCGYHSSISLAEARIHARPLFLQTTIWQNTEGNTILSYGRVQPRRGAAASGGRYLSLFLAILFLPTRPRSLHRSAPTAKSRAWASSPATPRCHSANNRWACRILFQRGSRASRPRGGRGTRPWRAVPSRAEPNRAVPRRASGLQLKISPALSERCALTRTVQTRSVLAAPTLVTRRACAGCGTDALRDRHVAGSLPAPSRLRGRPSAGHCTAAAQTRGLRRGAAAVAARSRTGRDGDGGGSGRRAASRVSSAPSPCTRAEWLNV